MRTVFVNPTRTRKRRRKSRKPTRRHAAPKRRRSVRSGVYVRRNAGITPFVQSNPLILENPRRRSRRRRRNPSLNLNSLVNSTIAYGGGAAIGVGINILALRKIENDWMRNAARIAAALAGGMYLPGMFGGAMAGATLYPMFAELALMLKLVGAETTSTADLAADLEAALNGIGEDDDDDDDEELFVP